MSSQWAMTSASDGDMRLEAEGALERRARVTATAWTTTRQVHAATVVEVDAALGPVECDADAIVTSARGVPIAMLGADCALVALVSREGPVGIAHAGWKGLVAGVIENTVTALRALGANEITALCSPMIHPECYEFSPDDLSDVIDHLGAGVRGKASSGKPALDLPAGVNAALLRSGVANTTVLGGCTACEGGWYSWRARKEAARHALVCWRPDDA